MACGPIFFAFALFAAAELTLLVHVGGLVGGLETFALVAMTAGVGMYLARAQGAGVMSRLQTQGLYGLPAQGDMLQGPLIVLAGLLLITPGFISDAVGFLLLIPPLRAIVAAQLAKRLEGRMMQMGGMPGAGPGVGIPPGMFTGGFPGEAPGEEEPPVIVVRPRKAPPAEGDDHDP